MTQERILAARPAAPLGDTVSGGFELIRDLNERTFVKLCEAARDATAQDYPFLVRLRPMALRATPQAHRNILLAPCSLVDFDFGDALSWRCWAERRNAPPKAERSLTCLPSGTAQYLARITLQAAWVGARHHAHQVGLLFGMSARVTAVITALRPGELERISLEQYWSLRPRWEEKWELWEQLLEENGDPSDQAHRWIRLLAGRQLPARAVSLQTPARGSQRRNGSPSRFSSYSAETSSAR